VLRILISFRFMFRFKVVPYFIFYSFSKFLNTLTNFQTNRAKTIPLIFFLSWVFFWNKLLLCFIIKNQFWSKLLLRSLIKNQIWSKLFLLFYNQESVLIQAMATCHSLINFKGELTGNPLDVKLFEAIEWVTFNHWKEFEPTITFNQ